jgi:hypothetical protein
VYHVASSILESKAGGEVLLSVVRDNNTSWRGAEDAALWLVAPVAGPISRQIDATPLRGKGL